MCVILAILGVNNKDKQFFGLSPVLPHFIEQLNKRANVCVVVFGSPYSLPLVASASTVLMAYEEEEEAQRAAAAVLMGSLPAKGKLPISFE
jgi:hypothetical protein